MKYWICCPTRMIDVLKKEAGVRIGSVTQLDNNRAQLDDCTIPRPVFDVLDALWGEVFWGEEDVEHSPTFSKLVEATPKRPLAAKLKNPK